MNFEMMTRYGMIPYQRGGDGFSGIDCVSLALRYYRDYLKFELPESPWKWRQVLSLSGDVNDLRVHDLLFMQGANRVRITDHIGVLVHPTNVLHATSAHNGVVCIPLDYCRHLILRVARLKTS